MPKVTVVKPKIEMVEKVIEEGSVTLTMSHEEAKALTGLLGHSIGDPFYGLYRALTDAVDDCADEYERIKAGDGSRLPSYRLT